MCELTDSVREDYADLLEELFMYQDELNTKVCGLDWQKGRTEKGRTINWELCLADECVELLNSYNWKHWKDINGKCDTENAKVECIDILHFSMSGYMETAESKDYTQMASLISNQQELAIDIESQTNADYAIILDMLQDLSAYRYILVDALRLLRKFDVSIPEIRRMYIVKNALNVVRSNFGYKEGTYIKQWGVMEDNERALEVVGDEVLSLAETIDVLSTYYNTQVKVG